MNNQSIKDCTVRIVSNTEYNTRLESSLKSKFNEMFSKKCENNILVFDEVGVSHKEHITKEVIRAELFYDPSSECDCFQGKRFHSYIERFLNLSSSVDAQLELLESRREPVINEARDFQAHLTIKKVVKIGSSFTMHKKSS